MKNHIPKQSHLSGKDIVNIEINYRIKSEMRGENVFLIQPRVYT